MTEEGRPFHSIVGRNRRGGRSLSRVKVCWGIVENSNGGGHGGEESRKIKPLEA